ncbi:conserved hypothetical protein [metagenome]|uniref:Virulence factor domain-containing protein n=1 Tax=metagenome TaxID=256318 RepID=A0A2P2BZ27_9ZZZZ
MTEYQVTYWRELPSLVVARSGDDVTKSLLAARFQGAIDEAAMRLGDIGSDDYLAGWRRSDWTEAEGDPAEVAELISTELEEAWPTQAIAGYLDALGTS